MYQLVSAIAKPLGGDGRWQAVDIASVPLSVLYTTYSRVIATLTNPFLPNLVALDLNDIEVQTAGLSQSFTAYLQSIGANALPTTEQLQRVAPKWAKYNDAFKAGYTITAIHPTAGDGTVMPNADLTDLRLRRPATDYALFLKSCLVSVNGFYHPIDGSSAGIIVRRGNQCAQLSGQNNIGIVSFRELGSLTQVPITASMVKKQNGTLPLKNHAYVDLGQDVSNKSVLLVLGGYLHVLDQRTFRRVSGSMFAIDFNNLPYLERYFESQSFLDFSSLPVNATPRNPTQAAVAELLSDECITAYLTLPQSFFVLLDNPDVSFTHTPLQAARAAHRFISYVPPIWPIAVGYGKHANFFASYEDGQWAINCQEALYQNYVFHTSDARNVQSVSSQRVPGKPVERSGAFHVKIGSQLQAYTQTRSDWLAKILPYAWDETIMSAGMTLTQDRTLATYTNDEYAFGGIRSVTAHAAGKWYFELKPTFNRPISWEETTLGFVTASDPLSTQVLDVLGQKDNNGWGWGPDGWRLHPPANAETNTSPRQFKTGQWTCYAVDLDAGKMWFGDQMGFGVGDPEAGTNPDFTFTPGLSLKAAANLFTDTQVDVKVEANFGSRPFVFTPPTGFAPWGQT